MILIDVNVLVYAHNEHAAAHREYKAWLEQILVGDAAFGMADLVLSGFLRIVTHPRVFQPPTTITAALGFVDAVRQRPNYTAIAPGARHWDIFTDLCRRVAAKGNAIPDAYLAALAIESGSEWLTADRGFARFPGLRWRHPLD
jgi:hypothetical protein